MAHCITPNAGTFYPVGWNWDNPWNSVVLDEMELNGPLIVQVTGGVIQPSGANTGDLNLHWRERMMGKNMMIRQWHNVASSSSFNSVLLRSNKIGLQQYFVYCHVRASGLFVGRMVNNVQTDWVSLTTTAATVPAGSCIEFSCVNNKYFVVYETAAGVRTTPLATAAPFTDSTNTFPTTAYGPGSGGEWVGFRMNRTGTTNSAAISRTEIHDLSGWQVPVGRVKSGTQAYGTANTWFEPSSWATKTGYPHTVDYPIAAGTNSGIVMTAAGTVTLRGQVTWSATGTSQVRFLKNGVVIGTQTAAAGTTPGLYTLTGVKVAVGDVIEFEVNRTTTGTIAATTNFDITPTEGATINCCRTD